MAPNRVTKGASKPASSARARAAAPGSPNPSVLLLWLCLKGFLDRGREIDFDPVAEHMDLTKAETIERFERIRNALDGTNISNETGPEQAAANDETTKGTNDAPEPSKASSAHDDSK